MNDRAEIAKPVVAASPWLEGALLFTLICHAVAMFSMLLLLPGMPGGAALNLIDRARYVSDHPWLWRFGWLPWQITALSDLTLALAMLRTKWIAKLPAAITVITTLAAIVPDQTGQFLWIWEGPAIASHAIQVANLALYGDFERRVFHLVAEWGCIGYIAAALGWTWCFAAAGVWSRRLTLLSLVLWPIFMISAALLALKSSAVLLIVSLGNGIGFTLLMLWLAGVTEAVLRRSRHDADSGRYAPWRHPSRGFVYRYLDAIAESRLARALANLLPALAMDSDITNVVYVNYLVEAAHVEHFVVQPLKLQRLGPDGRFAMFTFLTFRHGHFGPRCFGPLRRLWPSPIQSNWRVYVEDPLTQKRGVQFLTIAITSTPIALCARLLAENVPMHVPQLADLTRASDGSLTLEIEPGDGTSPDVQATFVPQSEPLMPHPWNCCFGNWREMLSYCVPQDRALSIQPWHRRVSRQEIKLDIPLEGCRPMQASVISKAAKEIAGDSMPLCFLVESVAFRLLREEHDRY